MLGLPAELVAGAQAYTHALAWGILPLFVLTLLRYAVESRGAARAVRAALEVREWAREEGIELRIGVNTGEALVSLDSEPLATGDVINTAARL